MFPFPQEVNVGVVKVGSDGRMEERSTHNLIVNQGLNWLMSLSGTVSLDTNQGFKRTVIGSSPQAPAAGDADCVAPVQTLTNVASEPSTTQSVFSSSHSGLNATIRESVLMWTPTNIILARVTFSGVVLEPADILFLRWTVSMF